MHLVLIADAFPPMNSSAAIQLWDLTVQIKKLGHSIWVLVPSSDISQASILEDIRGVKVLRLKALKTKNIGRIWRAINEFLLPFLMIWRYQSSLAKKYRWDGVIFYSPTIFLGPIAWYLKKKSRCKAYLILRDIFPKWAKDLGLIKCGPSYYILKIAESFQYWAADAIGIQSSSDKSLLERWNIKGKRRVEVLNNWMAVRNNSGCSISIEKTKLAGRKIFVYAGNMGVAQNVFQFIDMANILRDDSGIGFLFAGRGDHFQKLEEYAIYLRLNNVIFHKEISVEEIPGLYDQCCLGLIALDKRHKTSNIPGKFISYMAAGLPAFAIVNEGNELQKIINESQVGLVYGDIKDIEITALRTLLQEKNYQLASQNSQKLFAKRYSVLMAASQLIDGLQ